MDSPLPSPRLRELKKPVPTPRRNINKNNLEKISENASQKIVENRSTKENTRNPFELNYQEIEEKNKGDVADRLNIGSEENTNTLTKRVSFTFLNNIQEKYIYEVTIQKPKWL